MPFEVATHLAALLILAAFVAGFVDAIAGGGGLITVPALLLAGASPLQALSESGNSITPTKTGYAAALLVCLRKAA